MMRSRMRRRIVRTGTRAGVPARVRHGVPAGFALLAVLWVMLAATVLGTGLVLTARRAVRSATNRHEAIVAQWRAEGCLERARAAIALVLATDSAASGTAVASWRSLDQVLAAAPLLLGTGCTLTLVPTGIQLDVDSADGDALTRLFVALGTPPERADSLVDALLDWRDADDAPRAAGAEAAWYRRERRALPRNGPFASIAEVARVRGFEQMTGLDSVLTTDPGHILLDRAPAAVLAALPGLTDEAIARIESDRIAGIPVPSLLALAGQLSTSARGALTAHYAELSRLTTAEPDAWVLTSRASVGSPAITVAVALTLKRAGTRAAIIRRRMWFE